MKESRPDWNRKGATACRSRTNVVRIMSHHASSKLILNLDERQKTQSNQNNFEKDQSWKIYTT
jgi:hypothetical protein